MSIGSGQHETAAAPARVEGGASDEDLLAGFGAGDPALAAAFVRRFQGKIFGVALVLTGDRHLAEDVSQVAFDRVWTQAARFDASRGSVGGWVATITRNLAIDATRKRRARPVDVAELLHTMVSDGPDVEESVLVGESMTEVRAAVGRLPRDQARAVVMAGLMGLTAREIALREGIPLGTAKTRVRTGLQRLRVDLGARTDL